MSDGLGWWLMTLGTLMRDFNMSEHEALEFPLIRAFALVAFHNATHPTFALERVSDGYIAQEALRLSQIKNYVGDEVTSL